MSDPEKNADQARRALVDLVDRIELFASDLEDEAPGSITATKRVAERLRVELAVTPPTADAHLFVIDGTRYEIARTACRCGGNWAWLRERPTGAWEMVGCICHHLPTGETIAVGSTSSRLRATEAVLDIRERELLDIKGPCSTTTCTLHFAHSGPCDIRI